MLKMKKQIIFLKGLTCHELNKGIILELLRFRRPS